MNRKFRSRKPGRGPRGFERDLGRNSFVLRTFEGIGAELCLLLRITGVRVFPVEANVDPRARSADLQSHAGAETLSTPPATDFDGCPPRSSAEGRSGSEGKMASLAFESSEGRQPRCIRSNPCRLNRSAENCIISPKGYASNTCRASESASRFACSRRFSDPSY